MARIPRLCPQCRAPLPRGSLACPACAAGTAPSPLPSIELPDLAEVARRAHGRAIAPLREKVSPVCYDVVGHDESHCPACGSHLVESEYHGGGHHGNFYYIHCYACGLRAMRRKRAILWSVVLTLAAASMAALVALAAYFDW